MEQRELDPYLRPIDPTLYKNACPANNWNYQEPPICQVDFGQGLNSSFGTCIGFARCCFTLTNFACVLMMFVADDSQNDFSQIRAMGFNAIRLCISWSQLEAEAGTYNTQYIDRIEQVRLV